MKTLEIPVKFQKGDTVYAVKQVKLETPCPICEGIGTIKYNEKDLRCPECMGRGKFNSNKSTHIVIDEPFIISTIKVSIHSNDAIFIKYKGSCGFTSLSRSEDSLFKTKEEAQIKCDELNREKVRLKVDDIVIQDLFKQAHPSTNKIQSKLNYYSIKKKFDKPIIVNSQKELTDGYVNYLLCKLLNINTVEVIVEN